MATPTMHGADERRNDHAAAGLAFAAPGRHVTVIGRATFALLVERCDDEGALAADRRDPIGSLLAQLGADDHELGHLREALDELQRAGLLRFREGRARWELTRHEEQAA